MVSENILRVPRSDSEGDFVLVNVSSNGPSPLDLKLLATEGFNPYICKVKQSRISRLRAKHSPLQDAQWETVLLSTLLQRRTHGDSSETDALDKLETIATITGEQVVLVFRKNISGITQRLGEIALTKDEDVEIDPTAWAGIAVTRATNLEQEVRDLTVKYNEQGNTIQKLNQQLEDLVEAKIQHETALLEKFRELLNAKKLKIRDQQRLLASAKVDPQKGNQPLSTHRSIIPSLNPLSNAADHIHTTRHAPTPHIPTASRPTKRKPSPSPSPSSSDFDNPQKQELPATPAQVTPEHSELDATEDEDSDDLDSAPAPPSQGLGAKGKVVENAKGSGDEDKVARKPSPPPRRELPFPRKAGRGGEIMGQQAMKSEPAEAMDEDGDRGGEETSDDEL